MVRKVLLRTADRLYDDGAAKYGTLPALLILATLVTGVVDAVSYLGLGHIFVANMTGNVAFLGIALTGGKGLSVWAPCLAVGCFMAGAWTESRLARHLEGVGVRRLRRAVLLHACFVAAAIGVALTEDDAARRTQGQLIALLAFGFGMQNAVVRKLAVPDLTTTVLTMTVTGLASDRLGRSSVRRLTSVVAILIGALAGAWLIEHHGVSAALTPALVLLVLVAFLAGF